jgi:hypothetical protein
VLLGKYINWSWWITAEVELKPLIVGDRIIITYGDKGNGRAGAKVQSWAEKDGLWFSALVKCNNSEKSYKEVYGSPKEYSVIPGPFKKCIITVPSIIKQDSDFPIRLSLTDRGWNLINNKDISEVIIKDKEENLINLDDNLFKKTSFEKIKKIRSKENNSYNIEIHTANGNIIKSKSNPAVIETDNVKLYWGDLHAHSFYHQYDEKLGYGDPCTKPNELFKYAKNVSHLDFVALTDGRGALPDNAGWEESQQAVIDNYIEGEFVTFKGWEIQMGNDGHRNVIYKNAKVEPHIRDIAFQNAKIFGSVKDKGMKGVLDYYKGRDDVILIPHHVLVWMNWDCFDENLDRLVEIYSCWGSGEYADNRLWNKSSPPGKSVQEALAKKHKIGFVGGSDSHIGYPGRSINDADRYKFACFKSGYTGVYSLELTRDAIFEALKNRHCYSTTGARIIVKFSVDGNPMGSVIDKNKKTKEHRIEFSICGTDRIKNIMIIRDGEIVYSKKPYEESFKDEWTDISGKRESYYYLRVIQVDEHTAWTSPIWV